jgi:excisionase family DNA binding protein
VSATTARAVSLEGAPPRKWLTLREAAVWTGLSAKTIARWKAEGRIRAKKTAERGGRELYRVADLDACIEQLDDA